MDIAFFFAESLGNLAGESDDIVFGDSFNFTDARDINTGILFDFIDTFFADDTDLFPTS